jgi:hypothetical protein
MQIIDEKNDSLAHLTSMTQNQDQIISDLKKRLHDT